MPRHWQPQRPGVTALVLILLVCPCPTSTCGPGLCSQGSGIAFSFPLTLPSGGATDEEKLSGALPTDTEDASFFFAYTGQGLAQGQAWPKAPPHGQHGVDYTYECKKNLETMFVDCACAVPAASGGPWEMCQQYTGLGAAGTMTFHVRVVALELVDSVTTKNLAVATPVATFTWAIDTLPPLTNIGRYVGSDGAVLGGGPAPCSNPRLQTGQRSFEITSNESPRELFCRLSRWSSLLEDFDGAMERWTPATVQRWLRDPKHLSTIQVRENLTIFAATLAGVDGATLAALGDTALAKAPYQVSDPPDRATLLAAIALQKIPYASCRTDPAVQTNFKTFDEDELDHGLKLFQVYAIDQAGNSGPASEYIWFVDLESPVVQFLETPGPFTRNPAVGVRFQGMETDTQGTSNLAATFVDHDGVTHRCKGKYSFRMYLDNIEITPRDPVMEANETGVYVDNMDALDGTAYFYRDYTGSRLPLEEGHFRSYHFAVRAQDQAGNLGPASTTTWLYGDEQAQPTQSGGSVLRWGGWQERGFGCHLSRTKNLKPCNCKQSIELSLIKHGKLGNKTLQEHRVNNQAKTPSNLLPPPPSSRQAPP
eukprot:m.189555 g.189555  ORF g.189555 m.189555 type:complete len:594 (+) comp18211_c0_seq1:193-1974(+)